MFLLFPRVYPFLLANLSAGLGLSTDSASCICAIAFDIFAYGFSTIYLPVKFDQGTATTHLPAKIVLLLSISLSTLDYYLSPDWTTACFPMTDLSNHSTGLLLILLILSLFLILCPFVFQVVLQFEGVFEYI